MTLNPAAAGEPGFRRARAGVLAAVAAAGLLALASCRSAPTAGHGDVAFRLLWEGESDVDLHVVDPAGEHLFFGHREAASGGLLDVDCNAGTGKLCARPIENVFWPRGTAPAGEYRVWAEGHSIVPAESPLVVTLLVLDGEREAVRIDGRFAVNGDRLGPFAVAFPPAGPAGWRLAPVSAADDARLPWRDVECPDGFRFRLRTGLRHAEIEVGGEVLRLEAVTGGGSIYRAGDHVLWAAGDELALNTPDGPHAGCRERPAPPPG
ncbi:MAG TPA: hypothetical protein VF100_00770 [Thermoanaerobaculia bacterium]